jgi:microcin C transport system substrate-binding protein
MKKQYFLVIALFFMVGSLTLAADVIVSHALAMRGEPKYPTGFRHFDYVNPNAPKGGPFWSAPMMRSTSPTV